MLPSENLNLPPTGTHPLNQSIRLVRLPTRLPHLGNDDVRIESPIHPRRKLEISIGVDVRLHAYQHVFLGVVEPVACTARANDALELNELFS